MPVKSLKELSTVVEEKKTAFESPKQIFSGERFGNYIMINEEGLKRIVDEQVEEKFKKLLEEKELVSFRSIKDGLAREEIESFIFKIKKMGVLKISIIDIVNNLKLPPEQIERIMEKFEKTGRAKEING